MAKFKVGDKVMLKSGLRAGEKYNDIVFLSGMSFVGVKTIDEVMPTGSYLIKKENESKFYYSEEMLEPANIDNIKPTFEVGDLVTLLKVDELPDDYRYKPCSDRNKYGGSIFVVREISKNEVIGHTNEDGYEYRIELLITDVKDEGNTTSIGSSINVVWWLPSGLKLFSKGTSNAIVNLTTLGIPYIDNPFAGVDLASDRADITAYCQNDIKTFLDAISIPVDMFSKRNDSDKLELHLKARKKLTINFNN